MPDRATVTDEAFSKLGLSPDASAAEIRLARRRLALEHHPDLGGDQAFMKEVNEAAASALRSIEIRDSTTSGEIRSDPSATKITDDGRTADVSSFTVEAIPVDAFEGLLIAAAWMGEVIDDDPPYRLEVKLHDPIACWCRLEVVPDAGSSTVSLTVGPVDDRVSAQAQPNVDVVRDVWVDALNQIDWT